MEMYFVKVYIALISLCIINYRLFERELILFIYFKACYGRQYGPKGIGYGLGAGTLQAN